MFLATKEGEQTTTTTKKTNKNMKIPESWKFGIKKPLAGEGAPPLYARPKSDYFGSGWNRLRTNSVEV